MILQLSCKPQVYYFLRKHYGNSMKLSEKDTISTLIFNTLLKNRSDLSQANQLKKYSYYFPIKISNHICTNYSIETFSPIAIRLINKYINKIFELSFYVYIMRKVFVDECGIKESIESFMLLYNIEENVYSFDALKKEYYRFKTHKKKEIEKLIN